MHERRAAFREGCFGRVCGAERLVRVFGIELCEPARACGGPQRKPLDSGRRGERVFRGERLPAVFGLHEESCVFERWGSSLSEGRRRFRNEVFRLQERKADYEGNKLNQVERFAGSKGRVRDLKSTR